MADELISRQAALDKISRLRWMPPDYCRAVNDCIKAIKSIPAVDTVEVVRCKDCKHYQYGAIFTEIKFCCRLTHGGETVRYNWPDDGFCSYGKRREENV